MALGVKVRWGAGKNKKVPFLLHTKACHIIEHEPDYFSFTHGCSVC